MNEKVEVKKTEFNSDRCCALCQHYIAVKNDAGSATMLCEIDRHEITWKGRSEEFCDRWKNWKVW